MTFDVAYVPKDVPEGEKVVCVVVDVLRASSTITAMFDAGCDEVMLTGSVDDYIARREAGESTGVLVCAENVAGNPREGADFGPSLRAMRGDFSLAARQVLMQTTNGTVAVHTLTNKGQEDIFVGCMRNAKAVMAAAVCCAQSKGLGIYLVCAGRHVGETYTIDDVYCAAYLVLCGQEAAEKAGAEVRLHDSARLAQMALNAYPGAAAAFADSASGAIMRGIGLPEDIELCAAKDVSAAVPHYCGRTEEGYLRLRNREE